ncbi:uncharacterized protein LOC113319590 [Papaver somniferum]|uniref:uncharacterized protein LOC113319590 n=1 Tax=Papaver somniferum TaxID=3469 RepID=UPI000E6FADAF|nr:uncharacterized protein LOC113319590 [Papaver somniferum]
MLYNCAEMTKGKGVLVYENAPKANRKLVLTRTPKMKVKDVRLRLFPSPDKVINISTDTIESSSRMNQASPTYTPTSPYKKSLNELFDETIPLTLLRIFLLSLSRRMVFESPKRTLLFLFPMLPKAWQMAAFYPKIDRLMPKSPIWLKYLASAT